MLWGYQFGDGIPIIRLKAIILSHKKKISIWWDGIPMFRLIIKSFYCIPIIRLIGIITFTHEDTNLVKWFTYDLAYNHHTLSLRGYQFGEMVSLWLCSYMSHPFHIITNCERINKNSSSISMTKVCLSWRIMFDMVCEPL